VGVPLADVSDHRRGVAQGDGHPRLCPATVAQVAEPCGSGIGDGEHTRDHDEVLSAEAEKDSTGFGWECGRLVGYCGVERGSGHVDRV
jgi:hypothetical protein